MGDVSATWLVTGGAGFIGANFVRMARRCGLAHVVNLDKLTYAGHRASLAELEHDAHHVLVEGDIADAACVHGLLERWRPTAVLHFAAESHVDRSVDSPAAFVETNVVGTFRLLEEVRAYWEGLEETERDAFRFLHVSTDEVYGELEAADPPFNERTPYAPNSPYAASKAASDHFVRAFHRTYGLPVLTTNCSNNYGPFQNPEKLIPLMIRNAVEGEPLPVYGDGQQIRDWLYVEDHCEALLQVLRHGVPGRIYPIGGDCERTNLDVVQTVCDLVDRIVGEGKRARRELIRHVEDRPGHDRRYAIDTSRMREELSWEARHDFAEGLERTVQWYLANQNWVEAVASRSADWIERNYRWRLARPQDGTGESDAHAVLESQS